MTLAEVAGMHWQEAALQVHRLQPGVTGGGSQRDRRSTQLIDQNRLFDPFQHLTTKLLAGIVRVRAEPANMRQTKRAGQRPPGI